MGKGNYNSKVIGKDKGHGGNCIGMVMCTGTGRVNDTGRVMGIGGGARGNGSGCKAMGSRQRHW